MNESKIKATSVGEENFETLVLKSDIPVLVDWWAQWCGPCRMITPIMDKLADEYKGRAAVVKINCDDNGPLAMSSGVTALPTVTLWHSGKEKSRLVGIRSIDDYRKMIDAAI